MSESRSTTGSRKAKLIGAARRYMTSAGGLGMDAATADSVCAELAGLPAWVFDLHSVHGEVVERAAEKVVRLGRVKLHLERARREAELAGVESLLVKVDSLLSAEELDVQTPNGRPRKLGALHVALAVDFALERGGISSRKRPGLMRVCLREAGLTGSEITTAIKYVAGYRLDPEGINYRKKDQG